ncbi:MAG: alanine/glycine:cation symporter family protein [Trueperella sp.]|nr:alanine/glycine:cation symporter family protein [Trueperella sp.]
MDNFQEIISRVTGPATEWLAGINDWLYTFVMIVALVGTGLWFTFRTRGVQIRHFGNMVRYMAQSRQGADGGISSFQAFAMGLATRVGIGNVTGVALAMILGGPGALFWMWVVALVGMATAFAEAVLAQLFKRRHPDGTFRGGPAYYIKAGLKSQTLAVIFAVSMVFALSVAMPMVQSNTIAGVLSASHGVPSWVTGLVVAGLAALVIFAGVRGVARVTEIVSPAMALAYIVLAIAVTVVNFRQLPLFFQDVFLAAFGLREALFGTAGGLLAALLNGTRRGLFSNEAGMGTNPNAAATATVAHPVQQGMIQSFGVFVDTILVCSATGFIILTSGMLDLQRLGADDSAHLTADAIVGSLGSWVTIPLSIIIFFFGFSSVLGAYAYANANIVFLGGNAIADWAVRISVVLCSFIGAVLALTFVWTLMDTAMFVVTVVNLVALVKLSKWVVAALRDYERQKAQGGEISFDPVAAGFPSDLDCSAWQVAE